MKKSPSKVAAMYSPSAISPSRNLCQFERFRSFFLLLFIILSTSIVSSSPVPTISYSDHCAHMVPEAAPTTPVDTLPLPLLDRELSHYSGGERILGMNKSYPVRVLFDPEQSHQSGGERILGMNSSYPGYDYSEKSLSFWTTNNVFNTSIDGLYKIQAQLTFTAHYVYHVPSNSTPDEWHHRRISHSVFLLNGFWSVSSKKLCMVGSAPWYSIDQGKVLNLEAVLKLNIASNLTVYTSLISGVLESLATSGNDPRYFEPISIVGFSRVIPDKYKYYNYSLVSEEGCTGGNIPPNSSLSLKGMGICATFSRGYRIYKLLYPSECKYSSKICTPLGGTTGNFTSLLSLYAIQCSESEKKLRYLVGFPKRSNHGYSSSFDPSMALIGEGIWDERNNQLCIVVCRILNQDDPLGNAHPGDCSIRLKLRYQAVWSIKNRISVQGEIWSNKTAKEVGYFERIKFQSEGDGQKVTLPGLKYEYTEIERVTKSCPVKNPIEKKGERYPDGHSSSMRFDVYVKHSERNLAWGYADPIFVGSQLVYDKYIRIMTGSRHGSKVFIRDTNWMPRVGAATHYTGPMNISYFLSFRPTTGIPLGTGISSLNASLGHDGRVEISAEGLYDDRTGHLCMVGCRRLISNEQESFDCEILVKMQFPAESGMNIQGLIMGSIESTRNKEDSLYFERLDISSSAITKYNAAMV